MEIVKRYGGNMLTAFAEGRLRSAAAYNQLDEEVLEVYNQIRLAFDPFGTLNPGVKQISDLKTLIAQLNSDYDGSDFVQYSPTN
jgi:hypothetical protein